MLVPFSGFGSPFLCVKCPFSLLMLLFWEENRRFGTLVGVKRLQSEPTCFMLIYFIPVKYFGIIEVLHNL